MPGNPVTWRISPDARLAQAVYASITPHVYSDQTKGITLIKNDVPQAAVLYNEFNGVNIFMHVAAFPGRRWMTRDFLHEAFKHPFITLGAHRITGWVESDNKDAIRFDEHLGFRKEAVLKNAGAEGQDVFLYVMTRDECRFV